jgi:microcystin-dependent protein
VLPISQNTALFSLLGTTYGGDGKTTFALPNLQGCAPMQWGQGAGLSLRDLGETGGEQAVTLLQSEMPAHPHTASANNGAGTSNSPANGVWATSPFQRGQQALYGSVADTQMSALATSVAGGGLPHNNMMPFLGLTFIIALQGVYPSRS